jgi:uncharacterized protein (DUF4415 family)
MEDRARTAAQELAHLEMMIELDKQKQDWRDVLLREALIPYEWGKLETTAPVRPRRKKVTVALDQDVLRWFHRLGTGYHGRINAVLLHAGGDLEDGVERRRPEPALGGDLGEGGAEEEGGVRGRSAIDGINDSVYVS